MLSSLQTSLLSAIIGDMRRTEGEVRVSGSLAYAPQNPWYVLSLYHSLSAFRSQFTTQDTVYLSPRKYFILSRV